MPRITGLRAFVQHWFFALYSHLAPSAALLALGILPGTQIASAQSSVTPVTPQALVGRYCVTCHNDKLRRGELSLETIEIESAAANAPVLEKIVRKLRTGAMPPAGTPRPEKSALISLASHLESELDKVAVAVPNPGRTTVHRLGRVEYTNAIRDLLAVEIDGEAILPADDSGRGFDNLADLLTLSPLLMERYMSAAERISSLAVGDTSIRPAEETYNVPAQLVQDERVSDDLPFGSRGGIAVHHNFPLDGEYVIKVRLRRNEDGYIRGLLTGPHKLDVRLDGSRVRLFSVGGARNKGKSGSLYTRNGPTHRGDIKLVDYELSADDELEVRFPAKAGMRVIGAAFLEDASEPEGALTPREMHYDLGEYKGGDPDYRGGNIAVEAITILGPYKIAGISDTPSRNKVLTCRPKQVAEEEPCARKILSNLARRAYRRPVNDQDVDTLVGFYRSGSQNGGFEAGVRMAIRRMLVSPNFLFRVERDPANVPLDTPYRIQDMELASRLAFFLWSSIPDDELLNVAEKGNLKDPLVLEQQVKRMLADPRSKALVSNFAAQWLYLRNLRSVSPDPREYPEFDENLRAAFQKETELLIESTIKEDRSVLDLLSADYTFMNERLARHYGIPAIYGSHFRRVPLQDGNRMGLLGQGSVLTVTSHGNRTSPVLRGKWVLENILGTPPPPPPPNVPALDDKSAQAKTQTMRQKMEQHRANPVCASCHARMDPIGFSLENFDAVGQWRATDSGQPIEVSGNLPDGSQFQGPSGLKKALLEHSDLYVSTLTEKLLTYSLGRDVQYFDQPAVRRILREAANSNYRWSSLVLGIVKSVPFQMRRTRPL